MHCLYDSAREHYILELEERELTKPFLPPDDKKMIIETIKADSSFS